MSNTIGNRIRELRLLSDMSQEELGRRVGVQRAAINKYEKGTVSNIPLHTIEKIADIFEVSPNYIVGWSDEHLSELSLESKVLSNVSSVYGKEVVDIIETYVEVTKDGKRKLLEYSNDVWKLYHK
jgi:transcriptional regulator with XRE-family HTH domain